MHGRNTHDTAGLASAAVKTGRRTRRGGRRL